ncbi:uncharacterized protein TNCT_523131 [Trichonephila clavata]|uniref:Uncharacterized protein n=1 Tax=Trichonephila clavata TaxID=2740835 RepID=A0A8X6HFH8_TRICU|nr:uncharacterized protein TNCT_523131 [Trichonephila clavata]
MNEESYNALYLYNAVIEYIYFVINLIETQGPKSINNVEKYVEFFNHDIYSFVEKFDGKDLAEKVGNMLCVTTPAFEMKNGILNLSDNYEYFRRNIYKEILINKVVDLILRGISSIKDICHNLNLNNLITIEEKSLKIILKQYPYFYIGNDSSVIVVQFHGLLGFEDYAYKTIVQYFQSYLQNISILTYDEIKIHTKCVPSCAIPNSLAIFCVFHICSLFKCDKNKVYLRKKFKTKKCGNQIINVDKIGIQSSESVPIGLLVSEVFGQKLKAWTGEITHLTKYTGLIQCVVNFSNGYQGIFNIYLYKTCLKYLCEVENMEDYLNIRDTVEFDADFSEEAIEQGTLWQATSIKVKKQFLKNNKFKITVDTKMYIEKIQLNFDTFKSSSKTCSLKNCMLVYHVLEKDNKYNNKITLREHNFNKSSNFSSKDLTELCKERRETSNNSQEKSSLPCINGNVANDNLFLSISDTNQNSVTVTISNNHCDGNSEMCVNKEATKNFKLRNDNLKLPALDAENTLSIDLMKPVVLTPPDERKKYLDFAKNIFKIEYSKNENSSKDGIFFPNLLFLNSAFVFGKIAVVSQDDGIAVTLHTYPPYEVFFKYESIFFKNDKVPSKDSIVLLFIPYFEFQNGVSVATLVYPLKSDDAILVLEQKLTVDDFVAKKFYSIVKDYLGDIYPCNCDLSNTLLFKTLVTQNVHKKKEMFLKCSEYFKDLKEVFSFSEKTKRHFLTITNLLYHHNLDISSQKLSIYLPRLLVQVFSLTLCSKKISVLSKKKKNFKPRCNFKRKRRNYSFLSEDLVKSLPSDDKNLIFTKKKIPQSELHTREEILAEDKSCVSSKKSVKYQLDNILLQNKNFLDTGHGSCTSLSSYKSCHSKSSDDAFYSCESLSDGFQSDMGTNESTIFRYRSKSVSFSETRDNGNFTISVANSNSSKEKFSVQEENSFSENFVHNSNTMCIRHHNQDERYFGLRCSTFLKSKNIRKRKFRVAFPSQISYCTSCQKQLQEITASISTVSESNIYFCIKDGNQRDSVTLGFPKCLVPEDILTNIKLKSIIKVGIIPNMLLHLSLVLYIGSY